MLVERKRLFFRRKRKDLCSWNVSAGVSDEKGKEEKDAKEEETSPIGRLALATVLCIHAAVRSSKEGPPAVPMKSPGAKI